MQLERVGTVTMSRISLKILGEVDDGNGFKGALLNTDTATWKTRVS